MQITNQMQYLQTLPKSHLFPSKSSIAMTTAGEQGGAASISRESEECPCPNEGKSSKLLKKKEQKSVAVETHYHQQTVPNGVFQGF